MSLTSDHFSHLFLGVWSPSAWSMRVCLHALRMSTTFTELIFQVFISGLVCWLEVTEEVFPGCALNTSRPGKENYLSGVDPSERCTLYNPWKILATVAGVRRLGHGTGPARQAKKEKKAKKRRSPCITDAHPCHAASPPSFLGSKLSPDVPQ